MTVSQQPETISTAHCIETQAAAEALCTALQRTVAELVALLDRETGILRSGKPQDIAALQARKASLSAELARDMAALKHDAVFVKMAVPDRLDGLRHQQSVLQKSLDANQEALAAMKSVSEALLRTIAAKVAERRSGAETYREDAALAGGQAALPSALSVDRSL